MEERGCERQRESYRGTGAKGGVRKRELEVWDVLTALTLSLTHLPYAPKRIRSR